MNIKVFSVGPKERSENRLKFISLACVLALGGGLVAAEYTGPSDMAEGVVVKKYKTSYRKNRSYKIDVRLNTGLLSGQTVTDTVGSLYYDDFDTGDTVKLKITTGRLTGLPHASGASVIKRRKP